MMIDDEVFIPFKIENDFSPLEFLQKILRDILKVVVMSGNMHLICNLINIL